MAVAMNDPPHPSVVATFSIPFGRYLSRDGEMERPLPTFAESAETLMALYRAMVLTRLFDEKAVALQRTGRLGTYASSLGQEAVGVGVASAMRSEDVLLPSFREQSAMLWRGVTMAELLLYWGGDERGSDFQGPRQDFPVCIPVASHFPHAVGVALAMQMRRDACRHPTQGRSDAPGNEPRVAVAIGGDGATSKGDFYEAINIAGVWKLPVVFVISNNQLAISVPRALQSAAETLAQKAFAAGIPGEQVDGNDVVAVRDAAERAIARARQGLGPTLIEAVTYRLSDHTTADDARRYRQEAEVSAHWKDEPVVRLRTYLVAHGAWGKQAEVDLITACRAEIDKSVASYLASEPQAATDMLDYLHAELPSALVDQHASLIRARDGHHA